MGALPCHRDEPLRRGTNPLVKAENALGGLVRTRLEHAQFANATPNACVRSREQPHRHVAGLGATVHPDASRQLSTAARLRTYDEPACRVMSRSVRSTVARYHQKIQSRKAGS